MKNLKAFFLFAVLFLIIIIGCSSKYVKEIDKGQYLMEPISKYYFETNDFLHLKYKITDSNDNPITGKIIVEFKNKKSKIIKIDKNGYVKFTLNEKENKNLERISLETQKKDAKKSGYFSCFFVSPKRPVEYLELDGYNKYRFKNMNLILYSKKNLSKEKIKEFEIEYRKKDKYIYSYLGIHLIKTGFIYEGPINFVQSDENFAFLPYFPDDPSETTLFHETLELTVIENFKNNEDFRWIGDGLNEYLSLNFYKKKREYKENRTDTVKGLYKKYGDRKLNVFDFNYLKLRENISKGEVDHLVYLLGPYFWAKVLNKSLNKNLLKDFWCEIAKRKKKELRNKDVIKILSKASGIKIRKLKEMAKISLSEFKENVDKFLPFYVVPDDMVLIPAGEYKVGYRSHKYNPERKVNLKPFLIDIYEVSNKQYCDYLNMTKSSISIEEIERFIEFKSYKCEINYNNEKHLFFVKKGCENYAVNKISWLGAKAYAEYNGKRLPTQEEWEVAARGKEGFIYPWGNEWAPKKCNWEENGKIDGYKSIAPCDSYKDGISPFGCFNMAGNVWEWVDSEVDDFKIHKGGCYKYPKYSQRTFELILGKKNSRYMCVGFRCVKDIEISRDKK